MPDYTLYPITLKQARAFIGEHHRHNDPPHGWKFGIGLMRGDELVGVAVVGRPISRHRDDGLTAEVTRCCVLDDCRNANFMLYAAAWRASKAMGYRRLITYTLPSESGASLRGAGFHIVGAARATPNGWSVPSRPRVQGEKYPTEPKIVWGIGLSDTSFDLDFALD